MALADRIVILHDGRLQQVGRPEALYAGPENRIVAEFFGRGMVLPVETVLATNGVRLDARVFGSTASLRWNGRLAKPTAASVKSEDFVLVGPEDAAGFPAEVDAAVFCGKDFRLRLRPAAAPDLVFSVHSPDRQRPGDRVRLRIADGYALRSARSRHKSVIIAC